MQQKQAFETLEKYGVNVNQFIRSSVKEKIKRDWPKIKEEKNKGYYYAERSFGSFRRELPLPSGVNTQKAEASFKKGVLTITVSKTEEARSKIKKITIKPE